MRKVKVVKEKKYTRGWSLSVENMMALKAESFERTMRGVKAVSPNRVLEDIVTAWRKRREKEARTAKVVKHDILA